MEKRNHRHRRSANPDEFDPGLPLADAKQEAFVTHLLRGLTQYESYLRAGYLKQGSRATRNTVDSAASRLAGDVKISARLEWLKIQAADEALLTREYLIAEMLSLYKIAVSTGALSTGARSLELLGRERNTFINKHEVGAPGAFSALPDTDLDAHIAAAERTLRGGPAGKAAATGSKKAGRQPH